MNYKSVVECNQVDTIVVVASVMDSRIEIAHNWFAVAIAVQVVTVSTVVAIVADTGLVVVALNVPPYNLTPYTFNSECLLYNATDSCE